MENQNKNYKSNPVPQNLSKPRLEDFYDDNDPRGCSTSELNAYEKALERWEKSQHKHIDGLTN
jgi:hypothetical protein